MNGSASDECMAPEPYDTTRFGLIIFVGTPMATAGVFTSAFLFSLFMQRKYKRSPALFWGVIALLDVAICAMYVLVFTSDAVSLYFRLDWLHHAWHSYAMVLYALSRIVQMTSAYMMLTATLERYLVVAEVKAVDLGRRRVSLVWAVLAFALFFRLPSYWEYHVEWAANCTVPFEGYRFIPDLAGNEIYAFYNFYIVQFIGVFVPFASLVVLNVLIITTMRSRLDFSSSHRLSDTESWGMAVAYMVSRHRVRTATYTMVAIVTSYLVCNLLDVVVKFLERVMPIPALYDSHEQQNSTTFYTYSTDLISILVSLNSFVRVFIYASNADVRADLARVLCRRRASPAHRSPRAPEPRVTRPRRRDGSYSRWQPAAPLESPLYAKPPPAINGQPPSLRDCSNFSIVETFL